MPLTRQFPLETNCTLASGQGRVLKPHTWWTRELGTKLATGVCFGLGCCCPGHGPQDRTQLRISLAHLPDWCFGE